MNGFMLLVLVVLAGQVSPGGLSMPPSLNPVQPASMVTTPPPQTDYGWQINPETGLLEYIVQISPDKAEFMYKNSKEQESTIPAVVAARVSKIIVRFGTKPIVSTPIEDVLQLPLVNRSEIADNLPTGRIKTLENGNGYDLQNVAGGTQPPPLTSGGVGTSGIGSSLSDSTSSLSDKMANALRDPDNLLAQNRNTPGSGFLQDAMGGVNSGTAGTQYPSTPANNNYTTMPGSMPTNPNGLPTSTATTPPPSLPGFSNSSTGQPLNPNTTPGLNTTGNHGVGAPGMGTAGLGTNAYGTNAYGNNNYGNNSYGNNSYSQPHSTATNGNYTSLPGQTAPGQTNGTFGNSGTRPGFASAPLGTPALNNMPWSSTNTGTGYNNSTGLGNPTGYAGQGYGNNAAGNLGSSHAYNATPGMGNQYTGTPYNGTPLGGTQYTSPLSSYLPTDPLSLRVADNRANVPGTSGISPSSNAVGGRSGWSTRTDGYPNDLTDAQRTGVENAMPVMFVLSLVVNFYLGMLIRKLLGRYRTLLASVRSQTV